MKLADAPNMIKIAGPIQQEAAKKEARIVPMLEMFSVFITDHQRFGSSSSRSSKIKLAFCFSAYE